MKRKGFPESYDTRRLIGFLANIKSGAAETACPLYSHVAYDIVPDKVQIVSSPDVVIVEGLNILQAPGTGVSRQAPRVFVSDFLDFSIYVDADEAQLERWYVERFQLLREGAFRHPESYFRKYAGLSPEEAEETALRIWREINAVNLRENILPTKGRARCILTKGPGHLVEYVKLRKL
jgi:type I pantothenate kinase